MKRSSRRRSPSASGPAALHAPWRQDYVEALSDGEGARGPAPSNGSFLRAYWLDPASDAANLVIVRTAEGMILLNRFPYAGGHLLVALGEARPTLLDYTAAQRAALWALTDDAALLIQRALEPQGINIGINQGRAAGAGVPDHLHVHLVPRWSGDVNFMAVAGQVRVISSGLERMAERYRRVWSGIRA
jgi:ATP adenylyltransferase